MNSLQRKFKLYMMEQTIFDSHRLIVLLWIREENYTIMKKWSHLKFMTLKLSVLNVVITLSVQPLLSQEINLHFLLSPQTSNPSISCLSQILILIFILLDNNQKESASTFSTKNTPTPLHLSPCTISFPLIVLELCFVVS